MYDFKKLFLCDGCHGDHAIGVYAEPTMGETLITIEWWSNCEPDKRLMTRLRRAWDAFRNCASLTHDIMLEPATVDQLIEALHQAKGLCLNAKRIESETDLVFKKRLEQIRAGQVPPPWGETENFVDVTGG